MTDRNVIRLGIIGTGLAVEKLHWPALKRLSDRFQVTAFANHTKPKADHFAEYSQTPIDAYSADYHDLLARDDVDAVLISLPIDLLLTVTADALAAGKHVICEKPLATTVQDAAELADLARVAGVVTAVPFVYRYYPTVREARARIASGSTGPVHLIHGSYLQDWLSAARDHNWRVDPALGGPSRTFADIGVHWCDLVEFCTGHRVTGLAARLKTAVPYRADGGPRRAVATEDAATLIFETDHGAIGSLVVSQVTPGRKNRLWFSLDGADASLAFDQEVPDMLWVGRRQGTTLVQRGADADSTEAKRLSVLPAGHPQGYQDCFNGLVGDVYAAIGGEVAAGLPTFADGLRAAQLTAAVLESSASRSWVKVAA